MRWNTQGELLVSRSVFASELPSSPLSWFVSCTRGQNYSHYYGFTLAPPPPWYASHFPSQSYYAYHGRIVHRKRWFSSRKRADYNEVDCERRHAAWIPNRPNTIILRSKEFKFLNASLDFGLPRFALLAPAPTHQHLKITRAMQGTQQQQTTRVANQAPPELNRIAPESTSVFSEKILKEASRSVVRVKPWCHQQACAHSTHIQTDGHTNMQTHI